LEELDLEIFNIVTTDIAGEGDGDRVGKMIKVKFFHSFEEGGEPTEIEFELFVPKRFPFKFPQLQCKTNVSPRSKPRFAPLLWLIRKTYWRICLVRNGIPLSHSGRSSFHFLNMWTQFEKKKGKGCYIVNRREVMN
jgi:hypothetical protein